MKSLKCKVSLLYYKVSFTNHDYYFAYFSCSLRNIYRYLFPIGKRSFDVFKLNQILLPYWWKYIGIGSLVFVFVYAIWDGNIDPLKNRFLNAGIYFGLIQITFSREKFEDEFSAQIRIKAMYNSVISLFVLIGLFSSITISSPDSFEEVSFSTLLMMFNSILIVYLTYFYWTKYGAKRMLNEE